MPADNFPFTREEIVALKRFAAFLQSPAGASAGAGGAAGGGGQVATPRDIMSQYGNPDVRKDPKKWAGGSYVGMPYSQCPSEYLLMLADFLDWQGDREAEAPEPKKHPNGKKFYYEYKYKDAGLARAWAKKNEGLALPPPTRSSGGSDDPGDMPIESSGGDDDIPFIFIGDGRWSPPRWERW